MVLDVFPKKYWWPLLKNKAVKGRCLAVRGNGNALLDPSKKGWLPHKGVEICGFLQGVFRCVLAYILIFCATGLRRLATPPAENVVAPWQDVNQLKRFVCAFPATEQRKRPAE